MYNFSVSFVTHPNILNKTLERVVPNLLQQLSNCKKIILDIILDTYKMGNSQFSSETIQNICIRASGTHVDSH